MPYITRMRRNSIDYGDEPQTAGELNYALTSVINDYLGEGLSYAKLNEVIGVLECAKLELYRRLAAPYEDTKIQENGDVYR
jgi:broad-specificity NMP kinase